MRPGNVELHIEKLVMHGFDTGGSHRIAEAVERELARLFAEEGVPPSLAHGGEVDKLDGGEFNTAQGSKVENIGAQVSRAVYGGLKR